MKTKIVYTAGFTDLLCLLFICLKLIGVIDWSWWWVLSPFWIPLALIGAGFLFFLIVKLIIIAIAASAFKRF